ncbi:hypothetical protein C7B76_30220 [filamentous cyanobacterium CCP2]|nr:hypothetical protein C7B76_30220 [filamentous cyanobacterium CCP2]
MAELIPGNAVSKRTTIVLPDKVFEALEEWADKEGRPTANLAAFLVELGVKRKFADRFPEVKQAED